MEGNGLYTSDVCSNISGQTQLSGSQQQTDNRSASGGEVERDKRGKGMIKLMKETKNG